ncbi:MAG: oxygen-dependent coproporphyrinogen oxidase [Cyclobacteriaceae bacterium]
MDKKEAISEWFKTLQDKICTSLEQSDGHGKFKEDKWERPGGGGGRSRVIENGNVIEKGGVNFSAVSGKTPAKILEALNLDDADFFATGVSIVIHPSSPWVPIIHMNVRYFEMSNGVNWYGGGIDLTPHYVIPEDAKFFHQQMKGACDPFEIADYAKFKKWADDYFFIRHRKETRGIGGIFFDRLSGKTTSEDEQIWQFVQQVGSTFAPTYLELINRNRDKPYTETNKDWQFHRRGRYVEFNLVYDKGTKFGLDTDGRTESILMSLPPEVKWTYNHHVASGSPEQQTLDCLHKDMDWLPNA